MVFGVYLNGVSTFFAGVIQKSLFRREDAHNDDEALLALAGIKQVMDFLMVTPQFAGRCLYGLPD